MTAQRSRKEEKQYSAHRRQVDPSVCEFCTPLPDQLVKTTDNFKIIRNKFPYSIWDGQTVTNHLMIVPLRHTDTVADFPDTLIKEYFQLLQAYEAEGYNTYSRAPQSKIKSVTHQHTHLIKTQGQAKRFVLLLRKPFYIRLVKS